MEAAGFFAHRPVLVGGLIFGVWYVCNLGKRLRKAMKPIATNGTRVLPSATGLEQVTDWITVATSCETNESGVRARNGLQSGFRPDDPYV
jgi:hypothetical protein